MNKSLSRLFISTSNRNFTYTDKEINDLEKEVRRKLNIMRMFTDFKDFNYEPPQMYYDRESGEIKMREKEKSKDYKEKKIISTYDDVEKEKEELMRELGMESDPNNLKNEEEVAKFVE
jgi:hypothetical protein